MAVAIAIITVSDTCSENPSEDTSGPALVQLFKKMFPRSSIYTVIVPDEKEIIENKLKEYCNANVSIIITTGGTGLSSRDVTPEATKAVIEKEIPSIAVALTVESLKKTPMAMISRSVCGIRNNTLIINFPGSKKAVIECFEIIKPIIKHAIEIIKNDTMEIRNVHSSMESTYVFPDRHISSTVDFSKVAVRPRESPFPMIEVTKAFQIIDIEMSRWRSGSEIVTLEEGVGRVVGESLYAKEPMPPFAASIKDGYACISSDGVGVRSVRAAVMAGESFDIPLQSGECVRINTGAPLPAGADCVVQVEDTKLISASLDFEDELEVEILVAPKPGQDVRPIGSDIAINDLLIGQGRVIDAVAAGLLASAGYRQVKVKKRPRVAVLSTGNELQDPSEAELKPAHIRDSNQIMLKTILEDYGYPCVCLGVARDEPDDLVARLKAGLRQADVVVCSGGVSMGERDLLKPVLLQDFGATFHFGRVLMKPGKPTTFASCEFEGTTKYVFGLPGNPVSAYVCCLLFVIRALRVYDARISEYPRLIVRLEKPFYLDPRPEFVRATLKFSEEDIPSAVILGNQCSSRLLSACTATVLLELPPASRELSMLSPGTVVTAIVTGRMNF